MGAFVSTDSATPSSNSWRRTRSSNDRMGATVAAAALVARQAADELHERDRIIRIARSEGATLRVLGDATGLSPQTIANICRAHRARSLPEAPAISTRR